MGKSSSQTGQGKKRKLPLSTQNQGMKGSLDAYLLVKSTSRKENEARSSTHHQTMPPAHASSSHKKTKRVITIDEDEVDEDGYDDAHTAASIHSTNPDTGGGGLNAWVTQRSEGEADARTQWGERSTTNLTATDVALANRRKALASGAPIAGWRVMNGRKVFVARTHSGTQEAEGAEGFALSMAFRKNAGDGKRLGQKGKKNGGSKKTS